ncbi:MAG: polysaccharide biosynthesis tyrosine autokinase [Actinobacteria bacterium]|nr:polysaccharide biosynthesis tyrosine autokinase [Actinomycetota bacterium]
MNRAFQEPPSASADGSLDLREFLRKVARLRWLILGVVVLVASLAATYSYSRPKVFSATATVLARPILVQSTDTDPLDNLSMPTEARLVGSNGVATIARTLIGSTEAISDLLKRVSVSTPENTQILEISFTDSGAQSARRGAQAFAEGYLEFKATQALSTMAENSATIREQIDQVDQDIQVLDGEIEALPPESPERTSAESERDSLQATRLGLMNQLAAANTSTSDPGEVVERAERPSSPISPKHQVDLALGILLGLALGITLASVREQLQDRIEGSAGLRGSLKAPVLGLIPESPMLRGDLPRLVTIDEPRSPAAEAYRTLRTNLLAACKSAKVRTILVTSSRQGEGKTTTAVNLAVALAQVGRSVVLISADLRYPRVHSLLGIGNEQGLGQVLLGALALNNAILDTSVPNLRVLPSGPASGDEPAELLQSDRMFEVIRGCRQADFVIIDGPPIEPVADSLVLADLVDAVLLVADAQEGTRGGVARSRHQLEQVGGIILGGILTRVHESRTPNAYGAYENRNGLLHRSKFDDADRELDSLRQEATQATRSEETSTRV